MSVKEPIHQWVDSIPDVSPGLMELYEEARLSLALTEAEKTKFTQQLGEILHYVEKLKQVDVTGVEPMAHASPVFNIWAADVPAGGLSVEQALQNAPAKRDNLIALPKVME